MGNQQATQAFKQYYKKWPSEPERQDVSLTPEVLLTDDEVLLAKFVTEVDKMTGEQADFDKMPLKNRQENTELEDEVSIHEHLALKVYSHMNGLFSCGFKNAEALIEELGDPPHARYYTVQENSEDEKKMQKIAAMKSHLLLAINGLRAKSSGKSDRSFTDIVHKYLEQSARDEDSENVDAAIKGLGFVLILLREIRALPAAGNIMTQCLRQVVTSLQRVQPGSFFKEHTRTSFILDATLNDAREFLVDLIEQQKGQNQELVGQAMRVLMSLALVRHSVEDLLIVSSLLANKALTKDVDLREEIQHILKQEGSTDESLADEADFQPPQPLGFMQAQNKFYTPLLDNSVIKELENLIVEGEYLYMLARQRWTKVVIGKPGSLQGQIVADKKVDGEWNDVTSMMLDGKLFCRYSDCKKGENRPARAFVLVDKETLEVKDYEGEIEVTTLEDGTTRSLLWAEVDEAAGGRSLASTPLMTDGQRVYVISRRLPTAAERESAEEGEAPRTTLWLETYSGPKENFKFISEVPLNKNALGERLVKDRNQQDWVDTQNWACDGKHLLLLTQDGQTRYFSLRTGNKIAKLTWDGAKTDGELGAIYFCPSSNMFFHVTDFHTRMHIYQFTLPEFAAAGGLKQEGASDSQSEIAKVQQELFAVRAANVVDESDIFAQLVQGSTAHLQDKPAESQFKAIKEVCKDSDFVVRSQRALIWNALASKHVAKFDQKMSLIEKQADDISTQETLGLFRYPMVTYLTCTTFNEIASGLRGITNMLESGLADDLDMRYAIDFLSVVCANLRALTVCRISLPELLWRKSDYESFLSAFNGCVDRFRKDGSIKCKAGADAKLVTLIQKTCQKVQSNALSLIHKGPKDILGSLHKELKDDASCSSVIGLITFMSNATQLKHTLNIADKLRMSGKDIPAEMQEELTANYTKVKDVFLKVLAFTKDSLVKDLNDIDPNKLDKASSRTYAEQVAYDSALWSCEDYLVRVLTELMGRYADSVDQFVRCSRGNKSKTERAIKAKQLMEFYSGFLQPITESSVAAMNEVVGVIGNVNKLPEKNKDEEKMKKLEAQFQQYSSKIGAKLAMHSGIEQLLHVTFNSLSLITEMDYSLKEIIIKGGNKLLLPFAFYFVAKRKRFEDKFETVDSPEAHYPNITAFVNRVRRTVSWSLGEQAYDLIKIEAKKKEDEGDSDEEDKAPKEAEAEEDKDTAQARKEKERKKVLSYTVQSNLLSGGIDYAHLGILSQNCREELQRHAKLIQDKVLLDALVSGEKQTEEAEKKIPLYPVIFEGTDPDHDRLVDLLQRNYARKKFALASLGQKDGMRITRAAFAVMLKFSDLEDKFISLADEIAMEVDMLDEDMNEAEKAAELMKIVKNDPMGADVIERFESASDMRRWISLKKKDRSEKHTLRLTEALKKKKLIAYNEEQAKKHEKEKEEGKKKDGGEESKKAETEEKKEEQETEAQIDTSGSKKDDKKAENATGKDGEKKDEDAEKLKKQRQELEEKTRIEPKEKEKIESEAYDLSVADLNRAFDKIIKKALFLVKLNVPMRFKKRDATKGAGALLVLNKAMSSKVVRQQDGKEVSVLAEPKQMDWETRLKNWKSKQTSQGTIKSLTDRQAEIWKAGISSVLALLQTAIWPDKIQEIVEQTLVTACRRVAGLNIMRELVQGEMPHAHLSATVHWFTSALRNNKNKLSHYMDNTKGQGLHFETLARKYFFDIINSLIRKYQQIGRKRVLNDNDHEVLSIILDALKWNYTARDHGSLAQSNLFRVLRRADGTSLAGVRQMWGHDYKAVIEAPLSTKTGADIVELFEMLFLTVIGRMVEVDFGSDLKLAKASATGGGPVPRMHRAKSVMDENVSEQLIQQAFEIIFREIERYTFMLSDFMGIDWESFARSRNEDRKDGKEEKIGLGSKLLDEMNLLDLGLNQVRIQRWWRGCLSRRKTYQELKFKAKATRECVRFLEGKAPEKKAKKDDETVTENTAADSKVEVEDIKVDVADVKELTEEEKKAAEAKAEEEAAAKKEKLEQERQEFDKSIRKAMDQRLSDQVDQAKGLYSEDFLVRMLRMVELFANVASVSSHPMAMIKRVANPKYLGNLLRLLLIASPNVKIIVLRILEHLIRVGIPIELFETAVQQLTRSGNALVTQIMEESRSKIKFTNSVFLRLLFNYLYRVRSFLWSRKDCESEGQYAVSQILSGILRVMSAIEGTSWSKDIRAEVTNALLSMDTLSVHELDTVLCLLPGGEFDGISAGDAAMTSRDETVVVLGYSKGWKPAASYFKAGESASAYQKQLQELSISPEFTEKGQKVVALFYDAAAKNRQDMMLVEPASLQTLAAVDKDEGNKVAEKSPLYEPKVIKHLIDTLVQTVGKDTETRHRQSVILKIVLAQIELQGTAYIEFLRKQEGDLLRQLIDFLAEGVETKSDEGGAKAKANASIPPKWLEAKILRIRKLALESDQAIGTDAAVEVKKAQKITARLFDENKQLIVKRTNPETGDKKTTNVYLTACVNVDRAAAESTFECQSFAQWEAPAAMKQGLTSFTFDDFSGAFPAKAFRACASSQAVLIGHKHSDDIRGLFKRIFSAAKAYSQNKDCEKLGFSSIFDTVFLFVKIGDMPDFNLVQDLSAKQLEKKTRTPLQRFLDHLEAWANIKPEKVLPFIDKTKISNLTELTDDMIEKLAEEQEAEKEFEQELESAKKEDEKDKDGKSNKAKSVQEARDKALEAQQKTSQEIKEKIAKVSEEELKEADEKKASQEATSIPVDEKIELFKEYHDDREWWQNLVKIGDDTIAKQANSAAETDSNKTKTEQQMSDLLWATLEEVDESKLEQEHADALRALLSSQRRQCLADLLRHSAPEAILPAFLSSEKTQLMFMTFLKLQYNSAVLVWLQIGQKKTLKQMKQLLRTVFAFCESNEKYIGFIKLFFRRGVVRAALKVVKAMQKDPKDFDEMFQEQANSADMVNPYLLKFTVAELLKSDKSRHLLQEDNMITNIFTSYMCLVFQFQKEQKLVKKLLKHAICIVLHLTDDDNIEMYFKSGEVARIVENKLVGVALKNMNLQASSDRAIFKEQQIAFIELQLAISRLVDKIGEKFKAELVKGFVETSDFFKVKQLMTVMQQGDSFELLKYLLHLEKLDDEDKKFMDVSACSTVPMRSTPCRAHYSFPGAQKVVIELDNDCKLGSLDFFGIGTQQNGSDMKLYSKSDKSIELYQSSFYLFNPVQMLCAVGYGSSEKGAWGEHTEGSSIYSILNAPEGVEAEDFKPAKVWTQHQFTIMRLANGDYYHSGYLQNTCSGERWQKLSKLFADTKKIRDIEMGTNMVAIITTDEKLYFYGEVQCLDSCQTYSKFEEQKLPTLEGNSTPEVAASVSLGHTMYVVTTTSGKLLGAGRKLKALVFDDQIKDGLMEIPLPENHKCERAWVVQGDSQDRNDDVFGVYAILMNKETCESALYSLGSELIGQGDETPVAKEFAKVAFPGGENVVVTQLCGYDKRVVIVDINGMLWAWGEAKNCEFAFEEPPPGIRTTPTEMVYLSSMGMRATKISLSASHLMVHLEDWDGITTSFYCVGKKANDHKYLGESWDKEYQTLHEQTGFQGRKIIDFAAGCNNSIVILDGPKETVMQRLYKHSLPGGRKAQGLIHFFKRGDEWQFVTEDEYEAKKHELPAICFATRCPISDIPDRSWANLDELAAEMLEPKPAAGDGQIDTDSKLAKHKGVECLVTREEITGPRYHTRYTVGKDEHEVKFDLSETAMKDDNPHSISPQIFYRLTRPLAEGKELPSFETSLYYPRSDVDDTMLKMEIRPDLTMAKNEALLKRTAAAWQELQQKFDKFDPAQTKALIKFMNGKCQKDVNSHNFMGRELDELYDPEEADYSETDLAKVPAPVLAQRARLLFKLNQNAYRALGFRSKTLGKLPCTISARVMTMKDMLMPCLKDQVVKTEIDKLRQGSRRPIKVNRRPAAEFIESGKCDHTGEFTMLGQVLQRTIKDPQLLDCFNMNGVDSMMFDVLLGGEGSMDYGGPFRELLTTIASEVQSLALPLCVPTTNNRNDHGACRDCWTLNPASNTPTHRELFKLLGYFLGFAARTKSAMDYSFPPVLWKRLFGEPTTMEDLKAFDQFTYKVLEDTISAAEKYSPAEFDAVIDERFQTYLSNQKLVELCPGGSSKQVTHENHKEFVELVTKVRLNEAQKQLDWIKEGFEQVIPLEVISFLSWDDIELRICGPKLVTVEALKAITAVGGGERMGKLFWEMFESFSQEERKAYLKYVWGRSKIPSDTSGLAYTHRVDIHTHMPTDAFPIAHTCFFSVDVPPYETVEQMASKFRYAMAMCGEIDGDYGADDIRSEGD